MLDGTLRSEDLVHPTNRIRSSDEEERGRGEGLKRCLRKSVAQRGGDGWGGGEGGWQNKNRYPITIYNDVRISRQKQKQTNKTNENKNKDN